MIIIGITGTLGAGKGTIVEYLENEKGFTHYSVRGFLIEEIKRRKLEINRDSMTNVANELRAANSSSYVIDQLYNQAVEKGDHCIIESIRTEGEIKSLRQKKNFYLLAIDAKSKIRFDRIKLRKSETDHISYETFLQNEEREFESDDPNKQNLKRCIELADFILTNNGDITQLYEQVDQIMLNIL